jgi:hypothetical protein
MILASQVLAQESTLQKAASHVHTVAFCRSPDVTFCAKITQYAQIKLILYKIGLD